jgi:hypothetical protein
MMHNENGRTLVLVETLQLANECITKMKIDNIPNLFNLVM